MESCCLLAQLWQRRLLVRGTSSTAAIYERYLVLFNNSDLLSFRIRVALEFNITWPVYHMAIDFYNCSALEELCCHVTFLEQVNLLLCTSNTNYFCPNCVFSRPWFSQGGRVLAHCFKCLPHRKE